MIKIIGSFKPFYIIGLISTLYLVYLLLNYNLRPCSVHQWRQTDSASYALNYFQNPNSNFFFPQVQSQQGYHGYVISEFPILYWITGKLYGWFGFNEVILRLISFLFFIASVLGLVKIFSLFSRNQAGGIVIGLLLFCFPFFVYYSFNYLPNIPGFGCSILAWYFFYDYIIRAKKTSLLWMFMCMTMAGLFKPTELINLVAMSCLWGLLYFKLIPNPEQNQSLLKRDTIHFSKLALFSFLINFIWVVYGRGYSVALEYGGNLLSIIPIWNMKSDQIQQTLGVFKSKWYYQLVWPYTGYLVCLIYLLVTIFKSRMNQLLWWTVQISMVGQIAYILLFFDAFYHHDYYMLNIVIVPIMAILCFVEALSRIKLNIWQRRIAAVAVLFLLFMSLKHTVYIMHERYYGILMEHINPELNTLEPYLRSLGIEKDDKVLSCPDPSPNISLYLMNQKGWSYNKELDQNKLQRFKSYGAKYLILNKPVINNSELLMDLNRDKLGEYNGIQIFRIQ